MYYYNLIMYYDGIILVLLFNYCGILIVLLSEVGGVKPSGTPTGKSFRFVRACVRARRGEAA